MTDNAKPPFAGTSEATCSVGFRLTTLPHIDGKITQELQEYTGDVTRTLTRWVMDSREKGVHDALVQLGWTPPNTRIADTGGANAIKANMILTNSGANQGIDANK